MSDKKDALVRNAASEKQVKSAGHKERLREKEQKKDLQAMLNTIEGRRFIWRLFEECKVFKTIWESSAKIHFNAGKHDFGLWLMSETIAADSEAYLQMQKEAIESNKGSL